MNPKSSILKPVSRNESFFMIDNYVKVYPDFIKVIKYHRPISKRYDNLEPIDNNKLEININPFDEKEKFENFGLEEDEETSTLAVDYLNKSLFRTRMVISDYILCNDFTHFATFTFSPEKVGKHTRYNFGLASKLLSNWLRVEQQNHKRIHGSHFSYLIVPEQHKDGAWHFHAVISGYKNQTLEFSHHSNKFATVSEKIKKSRKNCHFFTRYNLGRSEIQPIKDRHRLASYVKKYITKSLISQKGKRRYWCSKNLKKPQVLYNVFSKFHKSFNQHRLLFETDYFNIYKFDSTSDEFQIIDKFFTDNFRRNPQFYDKPQNRVFDQLKLPLP